MRMLKKIVAIVMATCALMSTSITAFAADHWVQDAVTQQWSLCSDNGIRYTGTKYVNNNWYCFNTSGEMCTGWQLLNNKWYCFAPTGEMYINCTTPDGYLVGPDGVWINLTVPAGAPVAALNYDATRWAELDIINQERAKVGSAPLVMNHTLNLIAQDRAVETLTLFAHERPNGEKCFTLFNEYGINSGWRGENLACGYDTVERVMDGWMHSEGHRENILRPEFKSVGLGVVLNPNKKSMYWTQEFWSKI